VAIATILLSLSQATFACIFPVVPLACVVAARELERTTAKSVAEDAYQRYFVAQWVMNGSVALLAIIVLSTAFPSATVIAVLFGLAWAIVFALPTWSRWTRMQNPAFILSSAVGIAMAVGFYPRLLRYQSTTLVSRRIAATAIPPESVRVFNVHPYSLDFLLRRSVPEVQSIVDLAREVSHQDVWVYSNKAGCDAMIAAEETKTVDIRELYGFFDYPVSQPTLSFLRPETRAAQLSQTCLAHVESVFLPPP
jgi:hypothetical protein